MEAVRYFKSWGSVNGKVVRDIELENTIQKGKHVVKGHIGKKPIKMTMKRKSFLAFPMNVLKSFSKTIKHRKTTRRKRH